MNYLSIQLCDLTSLLSSFSFAFSTCVLHSLESTVQLWFEWTEKFRNWNSIHSMDKLDSLTKKKKKMNPLVTLQRSFVWICLCPIPEGTSKTSKIKYFAFCGFLIVNYNSCMITSSIHFFNNLSIDLKEALFSLFQVAASSSVLYQTLFVMFTRRSILDIFKNLSKIYAEST